MPLSIMFYYYSGTRITVLWCTLLFNIFCNIKLLPQICNNCKYISNFCITDHKFNYNSKLLFLGHCSCCFKASGPVAGWCNYCSNVSSLSTLLLSIMSSVFDCFQGGCDAVCYFLYFLFLWVTDIEWHWGGALFFWMETSPWEEEQKLCSFKIHITIKRIICMRDWPCMHIAFDLTRLIIGLGYTYPRLHNGTAVTLAAHWVLPWW